MFEFIQEGPKLENQYSSDTLLQTFLSQSLPDTILQKIEPKLKTLGGRVISDILEMGRDASNIEPELIQYDEWGNRVDRVVVSSGWRKLKNVAAEEGLITTGYERKYGEYSRIIQFTKLYLFTPSSAIYTCPLAMTDGAARLIEIYGDDFLKDKILKHYTSNNPQDFWVSGQWMTEKTGGSDLGRTETIARMHNGVWKLYGPKWFTSAITAQTAMTLARIEENEEVVSGSRGLSLFYLRIKDDNEKLNNIQINRLKDKLGTRALPTAELELLGVPAILIGEVGHGIKQIATMLNITRIYNAISAVSLMRRALAYAKDYAHRREAFERFLVDLPLHAETLATCEVEFTGSFLLIFYITKLLGKSETAKATKDEAKLLRLLTPIGKLYTGKKSVSVISELLECMGGAGYLEDSGFPAILRDAQVLSIWEGTTNVLSLDVLRSIQRDNTFLSLVSILKAKLAQISSGYSAERELLESELQKLIDYTRQMDTRDPRLIETEARNFAYSIAEIMIGVLLVEFSYNIVEENQKTRMTLITRRWFEITKIKLNILDIDHLSDNKSILS
ncbi:MAG: acyl-CoA dehydrogenase [Candidatus Heimdallarchaeota archaeon]|nr:acyl-CoA dehydrogenase [Candidatus Heimdallarchaeota archaeon]